MSSSSVWGEPQNILALACHQRTFAKLLSIQSGVMVEAFCLAP